jgi:hypothetical protein
MDAIETRKALAEADRVQAEIVLARAEAFDAASARPLFSFLGKQPPADLIIKITPGVRALVSAAARDGGPASKARRTQAQRSDGTRARLLEAAIHCLHESGYAATTTSLVAQAGQGSAAARCCTSFPPRWT